MIEYPFEEIDEDDDDGVPINKAMRTPDMRPIEEPRKTFWGISKFNKPTNVFISHKSEIYNHITPIKENSGYYYITGYSLYTGVIGRGNLPIIIKSKYKIPTGDNLVYLSPLEKKDVEYTLSDMDQEGFELLCKICKISLHKGKGEQRQKRDRYEIVKDFHNRTLTFFEPIHPIDRLELRKIENYLDLVNKIIKKGTTQIDDDLILCYVADIPEIEPNKISPRAYMMYSPNKIVITNGGVGKTFMSYLINGEGGEEKPTEAGLLGFADAKDKHEGKLQNRTKQTYLEETQEERGEQLFGKLHTIMEQGQMSIPRGVGINVLTYSGLTFQGNPKSRQNDETLNNYLIIKEFTDFLYKISDNVAPFARRISCLIFDKELNVVVGNKTQIEIEKAISIIRSIAEVYREEFTNLFFNQNLLKWLNKPYEEDYIQLIKTLIDDSADESLKDFLKGQINSYRHARGMALRLGWLDVGIASMFKGDTLEVDVGTLIESSESFLEFIKKRNIKSYKNVISLLKSESYEMIVLYNFKNIRPKYLKLSLYTLFQWIIENPYNKDRIVPLCEIEPLFLTVKDKLELPKNDKYRSFSRVREFLKQMRFNVKDLREYGLELDLKNEAFVLCDNEKIMKFVEIFKVTYGTKDTKKDTKKKECKAQKTQKTQKMKENDKSVPNVPLCPSILKGAIRDCYEKEGENKGLAKDSNVYAKIIKFGDHEDLIKGFNDLLTTGESIQPKKGYFQLVDK